MTQPKFTPEQEAWITETLSEAPEPSTQQMDVVLAQFRKGAYAHHTQAA